MGRRVSSEQVSVEDYGVADNLEAFSAMETTKEINVERTSDDAFEYITVDSGGFDQLEFTFTEKCWVEIKDADGETIYGDLNRDSDILTVYGTAPLKILLGRTSAVTLQHNGTEIDLGLHTRSDQTARLTVLSVIQWVEKSFPNRETEAGRYWRAPSTTIDHVSIDLRK